ncbi:MAG: LPS assembly lipoprotein LptE [Alysiella sp.]|uniref:LPS-assembly lipoprotein LptE n=1 Tax=Alysiella sp. TaxID=1872483 RepID=UPI0026DBA02C|nr:LPS assembly lipoprotein LptE [Alysiella sp.]MDO4433771.1 LPS assembly lipoprotein LptE [Alysiella sp.]
MKHLFAIIAVLFLASCGFHLKGMQSKHKLPEKNWYIEGGVLQQPLERALLAASGQIVRTPNSTPAQLRLIAFDSKKDIYTITRAAKLNEYLLSLRVTVQVYYNNLAWGEPMIVEIQRVMPYADSMILGKAEEEATIWREIHEDAADQIVRRLSFLGQP